MNILVTICGRGGSKGVKNKNIREFLGYPLILYSISAAEIFRSVHSDLKVDIVVNSDSQKIIEIAKKTKLCDVINRPSEMAQDNTPKVEVIKHSLDCMEKRNNICYDYLIDMDITSPLRTVDDINACIDELHANDAYDLVFSVAPSRRNPYFNMVEIKHGFAHKIMSSNFVARQQAPLVYDMNASIYAYKRDSLKNKLKNSVFDGKCGIYQMVDTYVLDIDNEEDFEIMELLAKEYYFKKPLYASIKRNIAKFAQK